jgi:hypothetical protein
VLAIVIRFWLFELTILICIIKVNGLKSYKIGRGYTSNYMVCKKSRRLEKSYNAGCNPLGYERIWEKCYRHDQYLLKQLIDILIQCFFTKSLLIQFSL